MPTPAKTAKSLGLDLLRLAQDIRTTTRTTTRTEIIPHERSETHGRLR